MNNADWVSFRKNSRLERRASNGSEARRAVDGRRNCVQARLPQKRRRRVRRCSLPLPGRVGTDVDGRIHVQCWRDPCSQGVICQVNRQWLIRLVITSASLRVRGLWYTNMLSLCYAVGYSTNSQTKIMILNAFLHLAYGFPCSWSWAQFFLKFRDFECAASDNIPRCGGMEPSNHLNRGIDRVGLWECSCVS